MYCSGFVVYCYDDYVNSDADDEVVLINTYNEYEDYVYMSVDYVFIGLSPVIGVNAALLMYT